MVVILYGLGVKIQHFPLTLLVVLTTLTLPCERDKREQTAALWYVVCICSRHNPIIDGVRQTCIRFYRFFSAEFDRYFTANYARNSDFTVRYAYIYAVCNVIRHSALIIISLLYASRGLHCAKRYVSSIILFHADLEL